MIARDMERLADDDDADEYVEGDFELYGNRPWRKKSKHAPLPPAENDYEDDDDCPSDVGDPYDLCDDGGRDPDDMCDCFHTVHNCRCYDIGRPFKRP